MTASRRGVTLYQLLVLIAILAILAGFLFPTIVRARKAAERARSQNNLKQIGLACHNYLAANNVIPPGVNDKNYSTFAHLLPYVEQDGLFRKINFDKAMDDAGHSDVRKARILVFVDPNDPAPFVSDWAPTNYLFNAGTKAELKGNDGCFYRDSKLGVNDMTDGFSNTVWAMETARGDGSNKAVDVRRQHVKLKADALKDLDKDAGVEDFKKDRNIAGDRGGSWMDGRFLQTTFNGGRKLDDPRPDVTCDGLGGWSGPRTLDGTFNVLMGDGSVRRFTVKGLTYETWLKALTRAGGEALGPDF